MKTEDVHVLFGDVTMGTGFLHLDDGELWLAFQGVNYDVRMIPRAWHLKPAKLLGPLWASWLQLDSIYADLRRERREEEGEHEQDAENRILAHENEQHEAKERMGT